MYDDFWSGYNYGNTPGNLDQDLNSQPISNVQKQIYKAVGSSGTTVPGAKLFGTYDKTKFTKLRGPSGEQAEIYANGKMYIILPDGKSQVRTFPSRPWGIRYMQKRGWVLV